MGMSAENTFMGGCTFLEYIYGWVCSDVSRRNLGIAVLEKQVGVLGGGEGAVSPQCF